MAYFTGWDDPETIAVIAIVAPPAIQLAYTGIAKMLGVFHPEHYSRIPTWSWRYVYRWVIEPVTDWFEELFRFNRGANGGFAPFLSSLCNVYKRGDVLLGSARAPWGGGWVQPLGAKAERHLLMIAGSGSGKTVFLKSLIGTHHPDASAIIVDPKITMYRALAEALRKQGRPVFLLLPAGTDDLTSHRWNPLFEISALMERVGPHVATFLCDKLAYAIVEKSENENQPYFPDTARVILSAVIAHVLTTEPPERRNLLRVYELISRGYVPGNIVDEDHAHRS